ncbi:DUF2059 domain-containing protein [Parasedimentitalea psychrophila]|uniref:DUF2059 domain-containing protein n=1 Tax=Parasedimentitalea psychrophila TaxID=2997337 RepID=A0A9Y2KXY3_9RHOB|nr:DUF2059 domain-containing protein [Parasedimentitalea psychrophila]WIY24718.1 DUF2059 domain-containing protein [Parasedimentitalea psychrophila]
MKYAFPIPAVLMRGLRALFLASLFIPNAAAAADRDQIETFLEVTGFDVALDSIALSAGSAPDMLGLEPGEFGAAWARLSHQVFDTDVMHELALQILVETLDEEALAHASAFYASALGQRLVAAENSAHMIEEDDVVQAAGRRIISDLVRDGAERLALLKRMAAAIDSSGTGVKAVQQIQLRFLMAARDAGVIELELSVEGLQALMKEQEADLRLALLASSLAGSAYIYQAFSDQDMSDYVVALEQPLMQTVYELLNAVQYEITANRFELLASRLSELTAGQDI